MPRRLVILLAAAAVLALFLCGLFIHGRLGGVFLIVTAAIMGGLTRLTWEVRTQGRGLRLVILAAVLVGGVVKLVVS